MTEIIAANIFLTEAQRRTLQEMIQRFTDGQPSIVITQLEMEGITNDDPRASRKIAEIEGRVKNRFCAAIAIETLRMIGKTMTANEIVMLNEECAFVYASIPDAILRHFSKES